MSIINNIVNNIPDWLTLSADKNLYKLLDSFATEFDNVEDIMDELDNNLYLSSANINLPDYIHKIPIDQLDEFNSSAIVVSSNIDVVDSVYKLLTSTSMVGMFDYNNNTFFINNYDNTTVVRVEVYEAVLDENMVPILDENGNILKGRLITACSDKPALHHIWNCFDEFALILGISRLEGETNAELKARMIAILSNPYGSDRTNLASSIAREIGISSSDIVLKNFDNIEVYDKYDNLSSEFLNYIGMLKNIKPLTIAQWDCEIIDDKIYSVQYVPRIYNNILDKIPDSYIQSGIGDGNDLVITQPSDENIEQQFNCYIGLTADKKVSAVYYPRHEFKLLIDATGIKTDKIHRPKDISFSILAAENKEPAFSVEASQDYTLTLSNNFDGLSGMQTSGSPVNTGDPSKSDSIQIVPANTLFHVKDQYLKVKIRLKSSSDKVNAPIVKQMKVTYKRNDNSTGEITVPLNTPEDNVKNDTVDGSGNTELTIQKGEYYKVFATSDEFKLQGSTDSHVLVGSSMGIYLPKTII